MGADEDTVEDLADLYVAERTTRGTARMHIQRMQERRARAVGYGIRKAPAARVLGISVNTLDKWIARGRVKTVVDPRSGRALVDPKQLAELLVAVRVLREQGHTDGILAAAIQRLERDDPHYQDEFAELYGQSLKSIAAGNLQPLTLPDSFGPED